VNLEEERPGREENFFEKNAKKVQINLVGKKMSVYLQPVSEMKRLTKKVH